MPTDSPFATRLRNAIHNSLAVFLIIFVLHGALLWKIGPAALAADAGWYADAGQRLAAYHFNYREYFQSVTATISPVFYIGFVTLVALCRTLLGAHWLAGVLVLNLMALACTGALLVNLVLHLTHSKAGAWSALILFLICADMFNWARFVLTDTLFMAEAFALFYFIARAFLEELPRRAVRYWGMATLLLLLAPFCRPTGVLLLVPFSGALVLWLWRRNPARRGQPLKFHPALWGVLIISLIFGSVADAVLMQNSSLWPSSAETLRLPYYAKLYNQGCIVNARFDTYVAAPQTLFDYLAISARRLFYFFAFYLPVGFSRGHNLLLAVFFIPTYVLITFEFYGLVKRRVGLKGDGEVVAVLAIGFITFFAYFHAHTEVDFDWRYRLPIMPHLILLAALGVATLSNYRAQGRERQSSLRSVV